MLHPVFRDAIGRFISVNLFDREIAAIAARLLVALFCLEVIDIAIVVRTHNNIESFADGLDAAFRTTPRHNCRAFRKFTFQDLVPADDLASVVVDNLLHTGGHIVLQVVLGRKTVLVAEAELADAGLAAGAVLPTLLRALVTSYMDIFRREDIHKFRQYAFQKFEGAFFAWA